MAISTLRFSGMSAVPKVQRAWEGMLGMRASRVVLSLLLALAVIPSPTWASFIPEFDRTSPVPVALNPAGSTLAARADWDLIGAPETAALILGGVSGYSRQIDFGKGLLVDFRQSDLLVGTSQSSETNGGGNLATVILVMFGLGALVKYFTSDAYQRFITEVYFPQSY